MISAAKNSFGLANKRTGALSGCGCIILVFLRSSDFWVSMVSYFRFAYTFLFPLFIGDFHAISFMLTMLTTFGRKIRTYGAADKSGGSLPRAVCVAAEAGLCRGRGLPADWGGQRVRPGFC